MLTRGRTSTSTHPSHFTCVLPFVEVDLSPRGGCPSRGEDTPHAYFQLLAFVACCGGSRVRGACALVRDDPRNEQCLTLRVQHRGLQILERDDDRRGVYGRRTRRLRLQRPLRTSPSLDRCWC